MLEESAFIYLTTLMERSNRSIIIVNKATRVNVLKYSFYILMDVFAFYFNKKLSG